MVNLPLILSITKNHLLSRIKQSAIAALGVTFGIGTFIILVGFMTGLNDMLDGLILNRTPHIKLYNEIRPSERQPIEMDEHFADNFTIIRSIKPKYRQSRIINALPILNSLRQDERVKGAAPQLAANAFYQAGSIELNGIINGIDVNEEIRLFKFKDYIVKGEAEHLLRNNNAILLGAGIADKMSLDIGDKIIINTSRGGSFPLKIVGIFQSGIADFDNVQSYVNLKMAQQLIGEGSNYITDINIKLHDLELAPAMARELENSYQVTALDIKTANAQFETGTQIRNLITYAVSITLLIVAGFGIYNILNMLIYEKMNDIAILKATGFSGDDVKTIFISQALIIGIVGGVLGLIFGFLISLLISYTSFETEALPTIKTFPVNFKIQYYFIGIFFALISTYLAGYFPAKRSEKIDPVDIIRGQ